MADEPTLEIDDIQGHILIGFRGRHQRILGLRFHSGNLGAVRISLLPWIDRITSTRQALDYRTRAKTLQAAGAAPPDKATVLLAMAVTSPGMRLLGADEEPDDPDYIAGAGMSAASLRDPADPSTGIPTGWIFGDVEERTPHIVVIFGGEQETAIRSQSDQMLTDLSGMVELVVDEWGTRLPGDREHFGFVDGISQPAPRGVLSDGTPFVHRALPPASPSYHRFARPGRALVWPGQYVFGYPTDQADSAGPGPISGDGRATLQNGSLLVLRRLRQDVDAFRAAMARLAFALTSQGIPTSADVAMAWCVGRWPDGSPLVLAPDVPDSVVGSDEYLANGFLFAQGLPPEKIVTPDGGAKEFPGSPADVNGFSCPFFAHIRKVNPRDDPVDFGGSGTTRQAQMLRRGIPYGSPWPGHEDGVDRGLLFLAYQTSISGQFHRLMKRWVNDNFAPLSRSGIDPVIGASSPPGRALERRFRDHPAVRTLLDGNWVLATGGVYALTPGIAALRRLITGPIS